MKHKKNSLDAKIFTTYHGKYMRILFGKFGDQIVSTLTIKFEAMTESDAYQYGEDRQLMLSNGWEFVELCK